MCFAAFVTKYVLFFANLVFSLAGIALIGVAIVVLIGFSDLLELIPVNLNPIPISVIVLGIIVFTIAVCGCCGAIKESRCLLRMYALFMIILAAVKIYLTVVIFRNLNDIYNTVEGWIRSAFLNPNLRDPFHVVESAFRCCGVLGPGSYDGILSALPSTCCPRAAADATTCAAADAYGGCASIVGNWFDVFGDAIGGVLIVVIIVEVVAMIFALYLSNTIRNNAIRDKERQFS